MISTDDSKVEQPMAKTLARHPLVLLDQQLKNLAKEDDVPYKDNRPEDHVEGPRLPMRCWKCDGALMPEEAVDLRNGSSILQYVCVNCFRRWHAGDKPRPVIAA
jgi:hypothetical protein